MQLVSVKGDLTDPSTFLPNGALKQGTLLLLCHQTNCYGSMGAGVALALRQRYPEIFPIYKKFCENVERRSNTDVDYKPSIAGLCQLVQTNNPSIVVANLFGQVGFHPSVRQTNYEYIYRALCQLKMAVSGVNYEYILAFPKKMSSGLAGGTWEIILQMIKSVFETLPLTIYIVDNN